MRGCNDERVHDVNYQRWILIVLMRCESTRRDKVDESAGLSGTDNYLRGWLMTQLPKREDFRSELLSKRLPTFNISYTGLRYHTENGVGASLMDIC